MKGNDRHLEYSTSKLIGQYPIMFSVSKSIFNDRNYFYFITYLVFFEILYCHWIHISGEQQSANLKLIRMKFNSKGECKFGAPLRGD